MGVSPLRELIREIVKLGEVTIGFGPKHYAAPKPALQAEIDSFFAQYPALRRDPGYVEFLEVYSALLIEDRGTLILDIYGFSPEITIRLTRPDESLIEGDNFLRFAEILLYESQEIDKETGLSFYFDVTDNRPSGVYRSILQSGYPSSIEWYCGSFLEWLAEVAQKKARLL